MQFKFRDASNLSSAVLHFSYPNFAIFCQKKRKTLPILFAFCKLVSSAQYIYQYTHTNKKIEKIVKIELKKLFNMVLTMQGPTQIYLKIVQIVAINPVKIKMVKSELLPKKSQNSYLLLNWGEKKKPATQISYWIGNHCPCNNSKKKINEFIKQYY